MAWFETEHPVLLGIVHLAAAEGRPDVWQLPWTFGEYLERRGHWRDNVTANIVALAAAVDQGDQYGQAHAHCALGRAYPWLGRNDDAHDHLRQALAMFEQLSDQVGQANTFLELSWMFEHRDQHAEALTCSQRAAPLFETAGHQAGLVRAFYRTAFQHTLLGHHEEAFTSGNSALALCRQLGDRRSESHTLNVLGLAHHNVGNFHDAVDCYRQSIRLQRELGDHYHQATVNARLADTFLAMGDKAAAHHAWQQALEILEQLRHVIGPSRGYPDVDLIRAKLGHLAASKHGAATPMPHRE
jgi:tetratricopeptide (TPR) repeat protein